MALNEEYEKIGFDIIGAAYEVRNNVGRDFREKYYQYALAWELRQKGYEVKTQFKIPALYKGEEISDAYKADVVVDNRVIIETKALTVMGEAEIRQLISYLKLSKFKLGYVINFGAEHFNFGHIKDGWPYKEGIYRIVNGI